MPPPLPPGAARGEGRIVLAGTITKLPPDARGACVVCGSHGGRYPGLLAAAAGVAAVILNDAGIGLDEAGIGTLPTLEALGVAAATVSHQSCTIGDADDMWARGRISRANAQARAAGVSEGMTCPDACGRLALLTPREPIPYDTHESRSEWPGNTERRVLLLDSASLVQPDDAGHIVVTGSHGGLIGGDPAKALRADAYAAAFNDAGRPDGPGITRLPALAARGIAAITVAAASARIGDARSTLEDGIVSAANGPAAALGARLGHPARAWLLACAAH